MKTEAPANGRHLLYRSNRSFGETYRLLGDLLDSFEEVLNHNPEARKRLVLCRSSLKSSMDVLGCLKKT